MNLAAATRVVEARPAGNDGWKSILTLRRREPVTAENSGWQRQATRAVAALLGVLLLALARPAAATPLLTDASIAEQSGQVTRVVLSLTRPVDYQVFTLADPHRVVIDLPHTSRALRGATAQLTPGLVEQVRYGRPGGDDTRVVLDCAGAAKVGETYLMKPGEGEGYQLVVHLHPAASPGAAVASGDPRAPAAGQAGPKPFLPAALAALPPPTPVTRPQPAEPPRPAPAAKASVGGIAVLAPPRRPTAPEADRGGNTQPRHVVVIDPGHGGKDPGAISGSDLYEKRITLAMARELRAALERKGGYKVVLTRDRDVFIPLRERVALSRHASAEVFVSLHADTMPDPQVRGLSAYTLSERSSDAEAEALADRENKADLISGISFSEKSPEVAEILITLAQRETMNRSFHLARNIVGSVQGTSAVLPKTHRFAGFAVLKAPDVPSVLIELGFLSNAADEKLLKTPSHRRKVAEAIADGIDRYFTPMQAAANAR